MSLLKINDVKETKAEREKEEKVLAIGIDLGTSNSVVAHYREDNVEVIPTKKGNLLPSMVAYDVGRILVGHDAKNLLGKQEVLKSIKRLMGKSYADIKQGEYHISFSEDQTGKVIKIKVAEDKFVTPEEVSSEILKELKQQAEIHIDEKITKAVITVPAYFDEAARVATKNAATLAGLEVLRLINEPTAAALAYGLDKGIEGIYVIYDLGGGTFDVSILKLDKGIFKVLATAGDGKLGGDDVDEIIFQKILDQFKIENLSNTEKAFLHNTARMIKESFSEKKQVSIPVKLRDVEVTFDMNISEFNNLIKDIVSKTLDICDSAIEDSKIQKENIKGVVLVGGSTRILLIQSEIEKFFAIKPMCSINPDEVVAVGAAYQAAMLSGSTIDSLLLDVIPLSLGLEIAGGVVEKIIMRNSLIPIVKKQEFTTFKDGQTSMLIHVLQGDRELVSDLRSLGRFTLRGIPPMPAGVARIMVSFSVDADGLLTVEAEERITSIKQKIEMKPSWGLSFEEMKNMIENSMIYAESDMVKRLLLNSKTDAERLINIVKTALKQDAHLIDNAEINKITEALNSLITVSSGDHREAIEQAISSLEQATSNFAEIRMNAKIKSILEGKSVEEVEKKL